MSNFHLRPVSDHSSSPSPTPSTTPSDDCETNPSFSKSPGHATLSSPWPSTSSVTSKVSQRPLSPNNIRDVDLSTDIESVPRKYPAPPTGHDLMALFPPAPPEACPGLRAGPTSGYFQRQERAFFAQAGKEIVRVRMDVDVQNDDEMEDVKSISSRPWPPASHPSQPASHLSRQSPVVSLAHLPALHPNSRVGLVPGSQTSQFPAAAPSQPSVNIHLPPAHQQSHAIAGSRSSPQDPVQPGAPMNVDGATKTEFQSDEYRDNPDEAWRRPIPYAERRRAGKHTRRIIVRN